MLSQRRNPRALETRNSRNKITSGGSIFSPMENSTALPRRQQTEDVPPVLCSLKSHRNLKILVLVLFVAFSSGGIIAWVNSTHPQANAIEGDDLQDAGNREQDATTGATDDPIIPNNSNLTTEEKHSYQPLHRPIRLACAGDSLTLGAIGTNPGEDYPSKLQKILGDAFETHNYGVNSVTAIRGLNKSYNKTQEFQDSIRWDADIYLLMLGTNDAKFWAQHSSKFPTDMKSITQQATRTIVNPSSPGTRIILAIPPWVKADYGGIKNDILVHNVQPAIREFASAQQLQLVDMYEVTVNQNDFYIGDNLHLNAIGYEMLSQAWHTAIVCNHNDVCETGENCETCPQDCRLNCT